MTRQNITIGSGPTESAGCGCGCSHASEDAPTHETSAGGAQTTVYEVARMTCGHCVGAVTEELRRLAGVSGVTVDLMRGGASAVTVMSSKPLTEDDVRGAIDEAGYDLTGVRA